MKSFVDNSIMPWWNNNTLTGPLWVGNYRGHDISDEDVAAIEFYFDYNVF
jgi:hypothetical protein